MANRNNEMEFKNNPNEYDVVGEKFFRPDIYKNDDNRTLNKAFAISNEQLPDIFKPLNLTNKKIVTVGASGDQALNAILQGCKDVTIIDGNSFTRPFMEYKMALLKTVDFETFNRLFITTEMFNWKIYSKISHILSPNSQQFWDSIMLELSQSHEEGEITQKSILKRMFFINHQDRHSEFYKNEEVYNKLQTILNQDQINFTYIDAELQDFPKVLNDKYDLIFLSNIYFYYQENKDDFKQIIKELYKNQLADGGKIVVNYEFDASKTNAPTTFAGHDLEVQEVTRHYDGEEIKDTVWILNKPKTPTKQNDDLSK